MSDTVITVENLSKLYRLGEIGATSLRESAERWLHRLRGRDPQRAMRQVGQGSAMYKVPGNKTGSALSATSASPTLNSHSEPNDLWALRDVSFEVKRGEVLGLVGRNGAGKSTLLKILTRITEPTSGRAVLRGRVASLLEVGTGFHPELSGRDNVYLSGAILGMTKREITAKFDDIVAFAEVEKFIDTPVKRYSSGMYVRLAFAVAAHLDPEILLVDEVLAVGDAAFQKKCLGKMGDVAGQGRTVLFVSHNMAAVATLCSRSLLLSSGVKVGHGPTADIINQYYGEFSEKSANERRPGDDVAEFVAAKIVDSRQESTRLVMLEEAFSVEMKYRIKVETEGVVVPNFHFYTATGTYCFVSSPPGLRAMKPGLYTACCHVPAHMMNEGTFAVGVAATTYFGDRHVVNFYEQGLLTFTVRDSKERNEYNYGYAGVCPGILRPRLEWQVQVS